MSFQQRTRQRETLAVTRRVTQWNLWQSPLEALLKMQAELEQEMLKLTALIEQGQRDFQRLIEAGDPITVETLREEIRELSQKWNELRRRGLDISDAIREKQYEASYRGLGKRLGIRDLHATAQTVRALLLGLSLIAVLIPLIFGERDPWDTINLVCSLLLTGDFIGRLFFVTDRREYFSRRVLDIALALPLVAIVQVLGGGHPNTPIWADLARVITLLRFGRFIRLVLGERLHLRSISFLRSVEVKLVQRVFIVASILLVLSAWAMISLQGETAPQFESFREAFWWGLKIILTNDVTPDPATNWGRIITFGVILIGLGIGGVVIATITSILVDASDDRNSLERQQSDMNDRLAAIRQNLELLTNAKRKASEAATRIVQAVVNERDKTAVVNGIAERLVTDFGCLAAGVYSIDDARREAVRESAAGTAQLIPPDRIPFDSEEAGLVGQMAVMARRGLLLDTPHLETEPLPLVDGGAMAIPLAVRKVGYGVLYVVVPQAWLRDELIRQLLGIISSQIAQFFHDDEISTVHDHLLASISDVQATMEKVTATREYHDLLFAIAAGASALLNADMSKVMLLDSGTNTLRGVAWHGMDETLGKSLYCKVGEGLTGLAARTGKPVKSSNLLTDQRVTAESSQARQSGMRSELCMPIRARGEMLGVLSVMSRDMKRYSPEEEYLLGALAGQAGTAIENARLYTAEQARLKLAETMQEITEKLNQSLDEQETLTHVLEQARRVIAFDRAAVWIAEGDRLRAITATGEQPPTSADRLNVNETLTALAASRATLRSPSADGSGWLAAPMIVENQVVGMVWLERAAPPFEADDERLIERFAHQAALALRNARIYRALLDCQSRLT